MFSMILPDAQTIRTQTPFVFENASSNFVGVYNADLTTFHRIPPRATLTCTLKTQATASGVWGSMVHDPAVGNPAFGINEIEDFLMYSAPSNGTSLGNFRVRLAGTAASVDCGYAGAAIMAPGRQGFVSMNTGTDVTGYSSMSISGASSGAPDALGSGCRAVETSLSVSVLSVAAQEYIARFGFGDNVTGGAPTEGAYLLYDRVTAGLDLWQMKTIKTAGGAGTTQTATAVVPVAGIAAEFQKLRVEINSSASRADFIIDNVVTSPVGGLANIPAVTTPIKIALIDITKSAGATARFLKVDNIRIQSYPTTLR